MRLPRRVPWASLSELDQVCSWVFTDQYDIDSKVLAINRISAWRAITSLPHALESTLDILAVIVHDNSFPNPASYLSLRQGYATAIIRLVNGLVDPLQLGAYARSIASIASQLGLPAWLVELRHAATHEDLPSIELLREGAREAMDWLLHNYFLPTINPSSTSQSQLPSLRPLAPVLQQYKTMLKIVIRDASLKSRYQPAISAILKDSERWIAEAKVTANAVVSEFGWEPSEIMDIGDQDLKERWALERLCDALLEKGALVPLSKKKRTFPSDTFFPPKFSVLIWTSFLHHVQSLHPDFPAIFCSRIVTYLLTDIPPPDIGMGQTTPEAQYDLSFDMCLARWMMWSIETWSTSDLGSDLDLKKEVVVAIVHTIGPGFNASKRDRKVAMALLKAVCAGVPELELALAMLTQSQSLSPDIKWDQEDILVMEQRLNTLLSLDRNSEDSNSPQLSDQVVFQQTTTDNALPGWQLLSEGTGWRPSPIGTFSVGGSGIYRDVGLQ